MEKKSTLPPTDEEIGTAFAAALAEAVVELAAQGIILVEAFDSEGNPIGLRRLT